MCMTVSQRSPRYAYASCGKNVLSYLIAHDSVLFSYGFSVVRLLFLLRERCSVSLLVIVSKLLAVA